MKKINILLLCLLALVVLVGCNTDNGVVGDVPTSEDEVDFTELSYEAYLSESNPVITITIKDMGIIRAQLFPDVVENTVNNILNYISTSKYDGSNFHRVIENFMIQGGDFTDTLAPIAGEFRSNGFQNPIAHGRGVLSMARTNEKNSATSQFFIMHQNSPHLNGEYAAFGGVISGFHILDYIATLPTNHRDVPNIPVIIESMTVELNGYTPKEVIYLNQAA